MSLVLVALMVWNSEGTWLDTHALAVEKQKGPVSISSLSKEIASNHFDSLLSELKDFIKESATRTKAAPESGFAGISNLTRLKESLIAENNRIREDFDELEKLLQQKGLPEEILNRHEQFVRQYDAKYETLMAGIVGIESAQNDATGLWGKLTGKNKKVDWDGVIGQTLNFLEVNTRHSAERHLDPTHLPSRSLKVDKPLSPKLAREEWLNAFPLESATNAKARNMTVPSATVPPIPADLEETIEVKFTPEIRQLAESLGRNPVKIFNWVRNNIDFVPTWGSIQGAPLCLDTKSCNAFDTSSLLIALLRVSGIPARYQLGTIEVPIEQFKNWAGGFTDADAAASLFASGGIPSVVRRVNQGGGVESVKMEHVWAKAFIDYEPSGGAINAQGDTWVDLDAGFKQYLITSALQDLTAVVPFNRDAYLSNSLEESPVAFYRRALTSYIQQNFPGRTLNDFLTKKTIRNSQLSVLRGGLPYRALIKGMSFSELPQTQRQQFTIKVEGPGGAGSQTIYSKSLPELLGKRLTLSFMPAAFSDIQLVTQFGGLYLTPPYLLSVKPVLRLDGQEVGFGPAMGMGQQLLLTFLLDLPSLGQRTIQNTVTAGSYLTILISPHLINEAIGNSLARKFRRADDRFGTLNLDNSDRDPWVGGALQMMGSYFFNRLDDSNATMKGLFPIGQVKTAFAAFVSADVESSNLFGSPTALHFSNTSIDADLLEDAVLSIDGTPAATLSFEKLRGLESSYWEHGIFEPDGPDQEQPAVSTVRALRRARGTGLTQVLMVQRRE